MISKIDSTTNSTHFGFKLRTDYVRTNIREVMEALNGDGLRVTKIVKRKSAVNGLKPGELALFPGKNHHYIIGDTQTELRAKNVLKNARYGDNTPMYA